jgi:nucleotide-binding universal stress UspA family protein
MKILTIYDGTIPSKTALQYGLGKIKDNGGELVVLQVFPDSMFVDYGAGPWAEDRARAESARYRKEAEVMIHEAGLAGSAVRFLSEDGDAVELALKTAEAERVDLVLAAPRYKAMSKRASCPIHVMPGTILVPVDNSETLLADKSSIVSEAKATGSKVLLVGIIPVHLYSPSERGELERVRKETSSSLKRIKKLLVEEGIEVLESERSGYPDEEILKAAEKDGISLIMLPAGGKTPSELTKAAAILLDEPERMHMPVLLMHAAGA